MTILDCCISLKRIKNFGCVVSCGYAPASVNSYFYHRYHRLKHKCLPLNTLYLIQNEWKIRSTWRISQITLEYVLVLDPLIYYRSKSVCLFHFRPKSTSKVYLYYWTLMSVRSWTFSFADTKLAWFYQKK